MRKGKVWAIVKLVLVCCMIEVMIVISHCEKEGENISLLWLDLRSHFMENEYLLKTFQSPATWVLSLSVVILLTLLLTDEFSWKIKFFRWSFQMDKSSKLLTMGTDILVAVLAVGLMAQAWSYTRPQVQSAFAQNWGGSLLIAHAGGGIEEDNYTNSLEAFEASYEKGMKTIELDFLVTSDNRMVCWHDWDEPVSDEYEVDQVLSEEEFMSARIKGKYTPLSLEDVFGLMKKYEDVYIITDTKHYRWGEIVADFQVLYETAERTDSIGVLDRMIVQLYNHDMYDAVEAIYHFPNYILTMYHYRIDECDGPDFVEHCRFCRNKGIKGITMWEKWLTPSNIEIAKQHGVPLYVHTVNDRDMLETDEALGVSGFYTDFIYPDILY